MICKFAVYYTCSSGYCLGESLVRHFSVNFCCFVKIKPISNQFKSLVNPCRESKIQFSVTFLLSQDVKSKAVL